MELFNDITKSSVISDCGKYRFQLSRIWDHTKSKVLFIMHNPSIADAEKSDPTMTRCVNFARKWGYGGIYIGNLSPYIATNPADLKNLSSAELQPKENNEHVAIMMGLCSIHILAYGNPYRAMMIPDRTANDWHYLSLTKAGNPGHPLYLKSDLTPKPF